VINIVNFSDSTTMTRPRKDIVNIMILQQLQDILEALEFLEMKGDKDRDNGLPELKSRLLSLVALIRTPLERQLTKDKKGTITDLRKEIYSVTYEDKEKIYIMLDYIEEFLYNKDVTKWDSKEQTDRTDLLEMNRSVLGVK
jgi:hypothetical protein